MRKQSSLSPKYNSSSLANKYGIQMKENNSLGSLGLNPNLNIEDEYIENLLKQIHFMNMEIKLLKEKQLKSDGNGLWAVVNRTTQPMVTNIVESSQKYQEMKKQSDAIRLEKDIARLENDQAALINEKNFLENKRTQIMAKTKQWVDMCDVDHNALDEKIVNWGKKLKTTKQELQKQRKQFIYLSEVEGKIISEDESDKSKNEKQNLQIKNDEIIEEMMEQNIIKQIESVIKLTGDVEKMFNDDVEYVKVKEENTALRIKVANIQESISGANFEVTQLGESIRMAESEREKEIRERKLLTQEYNQKKVMLNEILDLNKSRKENQFVSYRNSSAQIQKAEEQSMRLMRSLQQVKKKLLKSQQINCSLSSQVWKFERQIQILKERRRNVTNAIVKLKSENEASDSELVQLKSQMTTMEELYEKTLNSSTNTSLDLFELERQLKYLRGRKEKLSQNLQLKDVINKLNIQDLHRVVQKNNDLNSTVSVLMNKWDDIKTFSRV